MPIGAMIPVVGGVIGNIASIGDRNDASQATQDAAQQILSIKDPVLQKLALEKYKVAGIITPEMEQAITQGNTSLDSISTDPRLKDAQMAALSKLTDVGNEGLNATDRQALNQIQSSENQQNTARQAQILQNMQQRGQGGSGAELAAKLQSSQSATNNAQKQGDSVAAQAQARALQAIMQSGTLGGQIRSQDYGEQADKARAQDVIKQWNAQNSQNVNSRNTSNKNQANIYNLNNAQGISNNNTGIDNQQEVYNKVNLPMNQYNMDMGLAKAKAGAYGNLANYHAGQAQDTAQMWSSMGQGAGQAYGASQKGGSGGGRGTGTPTQAGNPFSGGGGGGGFGNLAGAGESEGAGSIGTMFAAHGGEVPGEAKVKGDSPENDMIPAILSPGEVVLPRSVVESGKADEFLQHIKRNHKHLSKIYKKY